MADTPASLPTSCFTNTYRAMSIANATSVMVAARKAVREARSVNVTCVEKERRSATKVTPVAVIVCLLARRYVDMAGWIWRRKRGPTTRNSFVSACSMGGNVVKDKT